MARKPRPSSELRQKKKLGAKQRGVYRLLLSSDEASLQTRVVS